MESAIRACNYGATHVTIISRGATFDPSRCNVEENPYKRASYCRFEKFIARGVLSVFHSAKLVDANKTHATLRVSSRAAVAGGGKQNKVTPLTTIRADHIIAAVGFSSDEMLIKSMGFEDGALNNATLETSLRNVYSLGLAGTNPWKRTGRGLLQKFIESSKKDVNRICDAIVARQAQRRS